MHENLLFPLSFSLLVTILSMLNRQRKDKNVLVKSNQKGNVTVLPTPFELVRGNTATTQH